MVCALQAMPGQVVWGTAQAMVAFKKYLPVAAQAERVQVHAYGLVPTQALLMLTPPHPQALARFVQALRRQGLAAGPAQGRVGAAWQARFKSTVVQPDAHALAASWWVCALPMRLGLVDNLQHYPGSSFAAHAGLQSEPWLADWPAYWALGNTPFERQGAYRAQCQGLGLAQACHGLEAALDKGWLWSSDLFYERVKATANRPPRPRAAGRPVMAK
jgi:putative transposase